MFRLIKYILTLIGARLSTESVTRVQNASDYLRTGHWMASRQIYFPNRLAGRYEVYQEIAARVASRQVLYLEFGVAAGASMRWWSQALKHPSTVLYGFDSFEGLPETAGPWRQGEFNAEGKLPVVNDPRVKFVKGWFNESLPGFQICPHEVLVVNLDADLYSSTIYVLRWLRPHLKPGTLVYFDEMSHPDHEIRAFDEFTKESGIRFKPFAADYTLEFVAFESLG